MPPWLPDTAARAFAGRRRAVRFHLPHRWSVTQAAFRLSDGLRAQCWPAFHRGGRRSDRRSFKYMSFMCILIIIHIHSLCHALAFLANQRVTTGVLCKRSVKGEKMNIHLEKKLLEVMREIATEDADFIQNADHEALVSLAQGNTMLYSVSLMKEVLDTFTAEHTALRNMCWLSGVTMETVIQWTTKNPSKPARQPAGYAFEHTSQGQVFASILACYYWPAATGNRTKTNPSDCASTQ